MVLQFKHWQYILEYFLSDISDPDYRVIIKI